MAESKRLVVHPFTFPLDSTSAPTSVPIGGLTGLDNGEYVIAENGGNRTFSVKKRLGTSRYNTTPVSTSTFTAIADFWRYGTSLIGSQKFVATAGSGIFKDDGDGIWDTLLASGFGSDTAESYITIAGDYAVFSNDAGSTPRKWDQTTLSNLSSSPHIFKASVYHLRRLWTVGEQAATSGSPNPSRSVISAAGDVTDLTGGDASNIIFDEGDGDILMGVSKPFRGRLYFFKGPNTGSVHEVSGTTISNFTKSPAFPSAPVISHGSIITTTNDIFWASRYGFHSLQATQKFGNTEEFYISRPIQADFESLNKTQLGNIKGFYHPTRNMIGWIVPASGAITNGRVFVYNYAIGGWSIWTLAGFRAGSVMIALTPSSQVHRMYFGGADGHVYQGDQTFLGDANADTAYTFRIKTPAHLKMPGKDELTETTVQAVTSIIKPTGNYDATLQVVVDGRTQSQEMSVAGTTAADLLDSTFIMNQSLMAGESNTTIVPGTYEDNGRAIQMIWTASGLNEDLHLYGYVVDHIPGNPTSRETS